MYYITSSSTTLQLNDALYISLSDMMVSYHVRFSIHREMVRVIVEEPEQSVLDHFLHRRQLKLSGQSGSVVH